MEVKKEESDPDKNILQIDIPSYVEELLDKFNKNISLGNYGKETLEITSELIQAIKTNYTVWYVRRKCLEHDKELLLQEIEYVIKLCDLTPKNYQIWRHRRCIIELINDINISKKDQIILQEQMLLPDHTKNYHAWSYRQWLLHTYGDNDIFYDDLINIDLSLHDDPLNNSLWNHRVFLLTHLSKYKDSTSVDKEIIYLFNILRKNILETTYNESVWNYMQYLIQLPTFKSHKCVAAYCWYIFTNIPKCMFVYDVLIDLILLSSSPPLSEDILKGLDVCTII